MATCGKCGYDGPFNHGCGPASPSVSLLPRITELEAENTRLQDGYDGLKCQYDEQHDELLSLVALAERRKEALEGVKVRDDTDGLWLLFDNGKQKGAVNTRSPGPIVRMAILGWFRQVRVAIEGVVD